MKEKKTEQPKVRFKGFTDAWEHRRIVEVADYRNGKAHEQDIDEDGEYIVVNSKFVSTDGRIKKYSNALIEPLKTGEIAFVLSDVPNGKAIARTFLVDEDNKFSLNQRIAGITPHEDTDSYFLSVLMNRNNYFLKFDNGVGQTNLSKSEVENFPERYPSYEEQVKVGSLFRNLDQLITLHQREYEIAQKFKKTMLSKMFPKNGADKPELRFAGFTDAWEQRRLGDSAIIKGRLGWKSLKQEEYTQEGTSMIAGKHITNGIIDWTKVDHIPQWRYDESPEIMLDNGDVIFSKDGSLGNPALIENLEGLATINSTMMLVRTDDTIDSKFFYQVMKSDQFERLVYLKVSGSSIPHLFQADMNEFKFWAPNVEEQQKLGGFFESQDSIITLHQRELESLKNMKKTFLQQMFV